MAGLVGSEFAICETEVCDSNDRCASGGPLAFVGLDKENDAHLHLY